MEQAILATVGSTFAVLVTLILYLDRSHRTALTTHRHETRADLDAHRQETREALEAHRQETRAEFEAHRQETRAEFEVHRKALEALKVQGAETRASLEALRTETRNGFQRVAELAQAVLELAHRVGRLEGRLDKNQEAAETL